MHWLEKGFDSYFDIPRGFGTSALSLTRPVSFSGQVDDRRKSGVNSTNANDNADALAIEPVLIVIPERLFPILPSLLRVNRGQPYISQNTT